MKVRQTSMWGAIPILALIALATMLLVRLQNPREIGSVDSPLIGKPLPDLGQKITGPVIINFFASWCGPCAIEHPYMLVAKSKGVRIIGVAYKDSKQNIDRYLTDMGNPYEAMIFDESGKLAIDMGITGVPESYAVNKDGIITQQFRGVFPSVPAVMKFAESAE